VFALGSGKGKYRYGRRATGVWGFGGKDGVETAYAMQASGDNGSRGMSVPGNAGMTGGSVGVVGDIHPPVVGE
jgi:hypothetical protein